MKKLLIPAAIALSFLGLTSVSVKAATLSATNFERLNLGAKIVGPLGPNVNADLIDKSGNDIGDLSSSVACPAGFASCLPPTNKAGTIYTYVHEVIAGVNLPEKEAGTNNSVGFRLNFAALGFNGIAGYDFSEAASALGTDNEPILRKSSSDSLVWRIPDLSEWTKGEKITFFWQTTQAPVGPTGSYGLLSNDSSARAFGPRPSALASADVPEPGAIAPLALLSVGLLVKRRTSKA
ncbi:MAG: exosortase, PEP-CTERM interaction domain protein [Cyanobacteria bacterium J06598_1]